MQVAPPLSRENVYFLLRAIYIRFSNRVKQKFGCNSIFTLRVCRNQQTAGVFNPCRFQKFERGRAKGHATRRGYPTGLDQPCPGTIPVPSFTTINWSAATSSSSSCSPLGQRMAMSAVFSEPRPKCSLESFVE